MKIHKIICYVFVMKFLYSCLVFHKDNVSMKGRNFIKKKEIGGLLGFLWQNYL